MQAFAQRNEQTLRQSSDNAKQLIAAYEGSLAFRIASQKAVDLANRFPAVEHELLVESVPEAAEDLSAVHQGLFKMSSSLLDCVRDCESSRSKLKRTRREPEEGDADMLWREIDESRKRLEPRWQSVLNRLHARVNFGSEKAKAKLKVFNTDLWTHIDDALRSSSRQIEKSRMPFHETERIGLEGAKKKLEKLDYQAATNEVDDEDEDESEDERESDIDKQRLELLDTFGLHEEKEFDLNNFDNKKKKLRVKKRKIFDLEVYDDRQFYSVLLKTFIHSHSSATNVTSSMRADDIEALRKYRRKKNNVERKASKGRKIRYTVHDKLQNFMFPVPTVNTTTVTINSDRLLASLFQ